MMLFADIAYNRMIVAAAWALVVAHPGPVFHEKDQTTASSSQDILEVEGEAEAAYQSMNARSWKMRYIATRDFGAGI